MTAWPSKLVCYLLIVSWLIFPQGNCLEKELLDLCWELDEIKIAQLVMNESNKAADIKYDRELHKQHSHLNRHWAEINITLKLCVLAEAQEDEVAEMQRLITSMRDQLCHCNNPVRLFWILLSIDYWSIHWGQGVVAWAGTSQVHSESSQPVSLQCSWVRKWLVHSQCSRSCDQCVPIRNTMGTFKIFPKKVPRIFLSGSFRMFPVPGSGNGRYICSVPGHVTGMFPSGTPCTGDKGSLTW